MGKTTTTDVTPRGQYPPLPEEVLRTLPLMIVVMPFLVCLDVGFFVFRGHSPHRPSTWFGVALIVFTLAVWTLLPWLGYWRNRKRRRRSVAATLDEGAPGNTQSASVSKFGIEIRGSERFIDQTGGALALLQTTSFLEQIQPYLAVIKQARRSSMDVYQSRPTFLVGERTWQRGLIWYASCILHDGFHSKLYHENRRRWLWRTFTPVSAWTGEEAERKCMTIQAEFLRTVKADAAMQEYLRRHIAKPTHHLIPASEQDW